MNNFQIEKNSQILKNSFRASFGFTLAEVLITLGIIGVVAALTIPALMNYTQEKEYKTAYKKAYSAISQALLAASNNDEIVPLTGTYSYQGGEANFAALQNQFKITKQCTNAQTQGCWDITGDVWRSENYTAPAFIDSSGVAWKLRRLDNPGASPAILVDTNGGKKPNQYGKDRFVFLFSNTVASPWAVDDIGIPTKIVPFMDITNPPASGYENACPSSANHPCYFTSWLLN